MKISTGKYTVEMVIDSASNGAENLSLKNTFRFWFITSNCYYFIRMLFAWFWIDQNMLVRNNIRMYMRYSGERRFTTLINRIILVLVFLECSHQWILWHLTNKIIEIILICIIRRMRVGFCFYKLIHLRIVKSRHI